jgi:HAD superfamily hydrolase (TIGR01509 family)
VLRAILFDFNGVLVDDEPLHCDLLCRILGEEGIELDEQQYYRSFVGLDDRKSFRLALERAGREIDEIQLMRLMARKATYYQERVRADGFPFFPGALALVREAAARGLTLGVVSGALRAEIEGALRHGDVADLVKTVVAAEDVDATKPDPGCYLRALQELNGRPPLPERLFHPHEVVAIEDTPIGIAAAAAAGVVVLGVTHTYPASELGEADDIVERVADVTVDGLASRLQDALRA